ncbi:UNVERIFIED_CONTAM: putative protein S-acyltransferase 23 [Sesamum angustifolium]|uniref:S-acyltransferase n=1 Tax=Sesamum angustifolium TaxID=2727405 RepID=A0AAW2QCD9_9LAMI
MASSEIEIVSDSNEHKPPMATLTKFTSSTFSPPPRMETLTSSGSSWNTTVFPCPNRWQRLLPPPVGRPQQFCRHCSNGGEVNAKDNAGQTALHWAAVRGSIAAADVLLQNGARVEAADVNGYRPVHVAAQYGQTGFLNYIVAKYHADFDVPDNDGRSPLHWAAYKGFADTIRLLLFRDASQGRQDKEGCTPLHWAALRGNVEACSVLAHAGSKEELMVKDKAGKTLLSLHLIKVIGISPFSLYVSLLSNALRAQSKHWNDRICSGHGGKVGYAPVLFSLIVINVILFISSVLFAPNLTKVTAIVGLWGWTGISLAIGSLFMFARCSSIDPGYIKTRTDNHSDTEDPLLNIDLNSNSIWNGNWAQLCPTCKIARNITTNEVANAIRYGYLRGPDGRFRNPYNHGCWKNCSDFLIHGYTNDDEIAWPPLQQVAR